MSSHKSNRMKSLSSSIYVYLGLIALAILPTYGEASVVRVDGNTPLNLYPFIMSHDSATGEMDEKRDHIVADWAVTQSSTLVQQLDCGARAFDYRPSAKDGEVYAHHGGITIHVTMKESLRGILQWCTAHPDELVILYLSHFDGDGCEDQVADILQQYHVQSVRGDCSPLASWSYDQAKQHAKLTAGGSLLAVFDCMEENYDSSINCYGKDFVCYDSWPSNSAQLPFEHLQSYMRNTTATNPTTSSAHLWMTQAHWQSTAATVTLGTLHKSSLVLDEQRSALNLWVKQSIEDGDYPYLNILELEDVCDHGLDVYAAIQTVYLQK